MKRFLPLLLVLLAPAAFAQTTYWRVDGNFVNPLASQPANTFLGNPSSSSSAAASAMNPLTAANLMQATLGASVVATNNVTSLSGAVSLTRVDGSTVTPTVSEIVLLTGQTTTSQNGLWLVNSGAWTRPINFPSGAVILAQCAVFVFDYYAGEMWTLNTTIGGSGANVTIDTTGQSWTLKQVAASETLAGVVKITSTTGTHPVLQYNGTTITNNSGADCVNFGSNSSTSFFAEDAGNWNGTTGPCIVGDANGHPVLDANNGTQAPALSGTGCTVPSGVTLRDNTGAITVTSSSTTCTLTFSGAFTTQPNCTVTSVGAASVIAYVNAIPANGATTVVFHANGANGTFEYTCL